MKHQFAHEGGLAETRIGLQPDRIEQKCIVCGRWLDRKEWDAECDAPFFPKLKDDQYKRIVEAHPGALKLANVMVWLFLLGVVLFIGAILHWLGIL
jgi:hypothetical protein